MDFDSKRIEMEEKTSKSHGLSMKEVERRTSIYGKNSIEVEKKRTILNIIADQFKNSILWLLLIAAIISFFIGEELEGIAIIIAVLISVGFGTYLEYKADESLKKLKKLTEKKAMVIREGKIRIIMAEELVPGDVILIEPGSYIGADSVLVESSNLYVDESHLTGESIPVAKRPGKTSSETPLAERYNFVFAGSYAVKGEGKAIVISTGKNTELGKIAENLSSIEEEETPLMKNMNKLGKQISAFSIALILLVFFIGYFQKRDLYDLFLYSITLAVAAVPEGLTAVLTIMLTLSVIYMAKNKALVKKISSVETIGNIDILAVDKTGTITEGRLGLIFILSKGKLYSIGEYKIDETLLYSVLANTAKKEKEYIGDDIDVAIMRSYEEIGGVVEKTKKKYKIKKVIPFSPRTKRVEVELSNGIKVMKGAYELMIKDCKYVEEGKKIVPLDSKKREEYIKKANHLAEKGYRVIAVAYKKSKKTVLLGFLAFMDKEKVGVKKSIEKLKNAGIKVIMLTGDNIKTAQAVAERVGIEGSAVEWSQLEGMDKDSLYKKVMEVGVIARSTPESKLKIVECVIKRNHVIGVTGDGVNDALALKKAHVGVVMGKKGTDVSKEVADLILLDDNFYTMVKAIEYGRNLIKNILNFIRFQFTANASALIVTISSLAAGINFPLTPLQLLWINIIMDGPPALSLGFEKPEEYVMKRKPRKGKDIFTKNLLFNIGVSSIYISLVTFFLFYSNLDNMEKALSISFNTFVFFQLFNTLNCRSFKASFYEKIGENRILLYVIIIMAMVQIAVNYAPLISNALNTSPLSLKEWVEIIIISSSILFVEEIKKRISMFTKV